MVFEVLLFDRSILNLEDCLNSSLLASFPSPYKIEVEIHAENPALFVDVYL